MLKKLFHVHSWVPYFTVREDKKVTNSVKNEEGVDVPTETTMEFQKTVQCVCVKCGTLWNIN